MKILKVKGKNEPIILEQIKKKYGETAIVLSTKCEEKTGMFKWLKKPKTVVTIALKEEEHEAFYDSLSGQEALSYEKEQLDHASYEVLLALKDQMANMQEAILHLNQTTLRVEGQGAEVKPEEPGDYMKSILEQKLIAQGIKKEVLEIILEGIEKEVDLESAVRKIYTQIENILAKNQDLQTLPQVVFFIGPTGVGKTTTIAKLTAKYVLEEQKKVVLFTSDTYRIAAIEQLKTYADILGVEIEIIYEEEDIPRLLKKWEHADHIFIDTAGRSHKNKEQVSDLGHLLRKVEEKQVFLVINANTAAKDIIKIMDTYKKEASQFDLIVTKLDETDEIGNIVNIAYYTQRTIVYLTDGQNVPADIASFDSEQYTGYLLGRINYE